MDCRKCKNTRCFINKSCLPKWLEYTQLYKSGKHFSASKTIFTEGTLVTGIFVICEGKVKVLQHDSKGKEHIIRLAGQGQVLGHRGFSETMVYPISANTLTMSEIAYISNVDFFRLIRANKDLAFNMMMFYSDELFRTEQRQMMQKLQSSREKIASTLLMVIDTFGYKNKDSKQIDIGMSLVDFANFATISYSTLRRVLDDFIKEKILKKVENEYYLSNESALESLAGKG